VSHKKLLLTFLHDFITSSPNFLMLQQFCTGLISAHNLSMNQDSKIHPPLQLG